MGRKFRSYALAIAALVFLAEAQYLPAQGPGAASKEINRADAYYHFSMGHLNAGLAAMYSNRSEYLNKAIEHYKKAIEADPEATFLSEELSEVYVQAGRLNEAVSEAEERLKKNPNALDARRLLGRIYARLIGDERQNRINDRMLKKAIEQYQKIVEIDSKDLESWLMLGRLHKIATDSVSSEKAYSKALELDPDSEEALTGLALVYSDVGDTQRAIDMLQRVSEKSPSARTLMALAGAYEQIREFSKAAEVLRKAISLSPNSLQLKRALAQDLLFSNQFDEALAVYTEIAAADPRDAQTQLRLSQIYRQRRDFEKAQDAADRAKKLDPDNLEVLYNEVNLFEAQGKTTEAIALMKDLVDSVGKDSSSQAQRGNQVVLLERLAILYRAAEKHEEAAETFRKVRELDPNTASRVAAQLMDTYRQAKNLPRALEEAEAAYKKFPDDRMITLVRASLLADMGKGETAVAETRKLLNGKDDRDTYIALAQIYEKLKDYRGMGKSLDEAEKRSESKDEKETVYFMRGAMFERMKQHEESEREFRKVLSMNSDSASALNYLGYMFADRSVRLEEAHRMISRALELDPYNGAYLDSMGWVLYRMDRFEEAERYLRLALERVSRDPTVHDHLGDVLAKQGKTKEAMAEWQIAIREWEASPPSEKDPVEIAKINRKLEDAKVRLAKEASNVIIKQP